MKKTALWTCLVILLSSMVPAARAAGAMTIRGTITDKEGTPIPGVAVSDGRGRSTETASDGTYVLEEALPDTYQVTVVKEGLNGDSRNVNPVTALFPVDFQLEYLISGQVSPTFFNASSGQTLSITATTHLPPENHCVVFTDSYSTSSLRLTPSQSANPDGSRTWTGSFAIEQGRPQGTYSWTLEGTNCSALRLTNYVSSTYINDLTTPVISSVWPLTQTNVLSRSLQQPLFVQASDAGGAGISVSGGGISFKIGEVGGQETPLSVASFSGGWAKSVRPTLTTGRTYFATATVTDRAGNSTSTSWQFRVVGLTLPSVPITIPSTTSTSSSVDTLSGTNTFTFENVPANVDAFQGTWSGHAAHPGYGYLRQTIPLTSAWIQLYKSGTSGVSDQPIGNPLPAPPTWGTRQGYMQYSVLEDSTSLTISSPRLDVTIPSLSVTWGNQALVADKAVLYMNAAAVPLLATCEDPRNCGTSYPTTDPIPFLISPADASAVRSASSRLSAGSALDLTPGVSSGRQSSSLIFDLRWDSSTSSWIQDPQLGGLVDELLYTQSYPVVPPSRFTDICDERLCVGSSSTLHYGECTDSVRAAGTCHQILQVAGHVERSLVGGVNRVSTAVSMVGTKGLGSSGVFAELGGSLSGVSQTAVTGSSQRFYRGRVSGGEECSVESAAATAPGGSHFDLLISDSEGSEVESSGDSSWHRLLLSALEARTVCSVDGTLTVVGSGTELAAALVKRSYELPEGTFTGIARWSFAYRGNSTSGAWSCREDSYCRLADRAPESGGWQVDFPQLFLN